MKKYKSLIILAALILVLAGSFWLVKSGVSVTNVKDPAFIPLLVASSLVDSVNPCAFSVLIITVAFLASLGLPRKKVLGIGLTYVAGIFVVYLLIGLGLLQFLSKVSAPHIAGRVGAAILLFFGLSNALSYLFPNFPIEFKIPEFIKWPMAKLIKKGTLEATFLLGVLVALFEFPCTGGPYLLILGLLHDSRTYTSGLLYLLLYNLIFVMPLLVILLLVSDKTLLQKAEDWKKGAAGKGKFYSGLAMIFLAIMIFLVN
ncbi:MAG: hypothetical protein A3H57_01010 [Candidatus Taylorbacteria bacterium RIFCSPLOWO2_02_FULL_43_11]|uniref:Cytochrome C biogenesis protein transmembrane domain-containing protein n=1 Tax=Candidatus Taylorbacteria bacterium RIFCSPHIGHO2_02_FULL_43_32b TaxID=1802306 RepID=A0A1G2MH36_9BACT|nr:MAG: hypothetical protein A2743_02920 [Candidatus Taylorbacteria bacterium RIFCSPHIGHO2_01_FULL_43_47]OHA23230.1 MAG: hypothetical protein A3C72_01885 [Candidatus Taylorbacteria bacterium RIFCSPHIGHO2_02_FULL_43_32b]OHA30070.1 MAG: hypothetical protein A3B08_00030 [Candidatus Taylorbacteria bacterium RIFCSPLOWO2_01_FULL_43_44]OHA35946.1 MAG: hypothetical protein A3H57_01010 [Candidatus Taylorbacteria bacterium RIFCSPLOWO2_02_FULL_43_11]